jgi:hypothetical protein
MNAYEGRATGAVSELPTTLSIPVILKFVRPSPAEVRDSCQDAGTVIGLFAIQICKHLRP